MKTTERITVIRAMETIARCVNDENVFERWLMGGVADGDINDDTQDEDIICYTEDGTFKDLMDCFLRTIVSAAHNGGLTCDGITSNEIKTQSNT